MSDGLSLPLYFEGKTLADMEAALRADFLTKSGWLESAERKLAVAAGAPVPWFTYPAIRFLEREITADVTLFEYGGGYSTLYWGARVRRVVAVDHDERFVSHIGASLPSNAELKLIGEGEMLPESLSDRVGRLPEFLDPERTEHTFRSGQLNRVFQRYGVDILGYPRDLFDVVIIDGMARCLSTWAAIKHKSSKGFIIFDNSDRNYYEKAYSMLEKAGYRRIDFWGMGPINPYEWCTSVFYQFRDFVDVPLFSKVAPKAEVQFERSSRLGILVLGYNRPFHLQSVLESLRLQGRIADVHCWIDGTQGREEYADANKYSIAIAQNYWIKELRVLKSHLGIEKMMLDALDELSMVYDSLLVLEDDCFPLEGSVDEIERSLGEAADEPGIYSVYGDHFGFEPAESPLFSRFQGWGWAAQSERIRELLPDLRYLFNMNEKHYVSYVSEKVTPEIRARLDRTPGRDVLRVLQLFFSWDSATSFLTAARKMEHLRTRTRTIINTGITPGVGHFNIDNVASRRPPYNMITVEECWRHYDRTTQPCLRTEASYGLEALDRAILASIPTDGGGTFVELGAYDGVTQSNSVLLEKAGWRGLLVEANPGSFAKCVRARPDAIVEHAACVPFDHTADYTTVTDVGLMSMIPGSLITGNARADWLSLGEGFAGRPRQDILVPAVPLSSLLDKHAIDHIDLLLLDVEGSELGVLKGLDFTRHAPRFIVSEDSYDEHVAIYLKENGYALEKTLLERTRTRDRLYMRERAS